MAENLGRRQDNNGNEIGTYYYRTNEYTNNEYWDMFKALYDWEEISNLCPPGWGLPGKKDFQGLLDFVSIEETGQAFDKISDNTAKVKKVFLALIAKSAAWVYHPNKGSNKYGFSALPAGVNGGNVGTATVFLGLNHENSLLYEDAKNISFEDHTTGSVRCIQDSCYSNPHMHRDYNGNCVCNKRFTGENCNQCKEAIWTGENCDICQNPLMTGERCDECKDGHMSGPSCDQCAGNWSGEKCRQCTLEPCHANVSDVDGNIYKTVYLAGKEWMAENYRRKIGNYYYPDDHKQNKEKYGLLYEWTTANSQNFCPSGWRLPSSSDLERLISYAGGKEAAGKKLRAKEWNGEDEYGFSALPAGYRYWNIFGDTGYEKFGKLVNFLSTTKGNTNTQCMGIYTDGSVTVSTDCPEEHWGFSVRCIKD